MADQISIKEFVDPFTGEQVNKSKKNIREGDIIMKTLKDVAVGETAIIKNG